MNYVKIIELARYLEEYNTLSILLRLVLATIFGGIVGMERASKGHAAGLRTFALVCLGAALATITNVHLAVLTDQAVDASRIPAGVMSGIGFLGVGTIMVTNRNHIRGLTTAAGLWVTATLGIALGTGMIWISSVAFLLIVFTIVILQKISRYQEANNRLISLYLVVEKADGVKRTLRYLTDMGYEIASMERKKEKVIGESDVALQLEIDLKKRCSHNEFISRMASMEGILYLEEIKG